MGDRLTKAKRRLNWLNIAILVAFGLVALAASYWSLVRGPSMLERSDNPRLVEEELKIRRGTIFDVNSLPLAETIGENVDLRREYALPEAAPAVGYYSLRYGTSGIEEAFDTSLRGESADFWTNFWRVDTLGEPQMGRDVRLTLDSRWQDAANELLGERKGAVFLFSLPDVAVRAMVSAPGYDPNILDAEFEELAVDQEAPLLNRVTQGQYQPGLVLQPFVLAIAQRDGLIDLREPAATLTGDVVVEGITLGCQSSVDVTTMSWGESLQSRCPGPMITLSDQLGTTGLLSAFDEFGLASQPDLLTVAAGNEEADIADPGLAAIGQDEMSISPLQVGVALAALANGGQLRSAQLVAASQEENGSWTAAENPEAARVVIPPRIAKDILDAFSLNDGILEQAVNVLSGPEGEQNSWYLGLAPAAEPRYGVVVVVEDDQGESAASEIGRDLLRSVLDPEQQ